MPICPRFARALAAALAAPDADPIGTARCIETLTSLLPEPPADGSPPWDLSKLSDREFAALERLHARATGGIPPRPLRRPPRKPLTERETRAMEMACVLDVAEDENRKLTDDDLLAARNCLSSMFFPMATLTQLLPPEVFGTPSRSLPAPAEPEPKELQPCDSSEAAPTPAPLADNVVPFSEAERGALRYGATFVSNDSPGPFWRLPEDANMSQIIDIKELR
jgi:hypothetical protein